ncbi:MAG: hypothetical protein OXH52_14770 [Gammaproteobacteria bacterium]|nr:hypothetical protein [Gammaproteobacteria bacterium]
MSAGAVVVSIMVVGKIGEADWMSVVQRELATSEECAEALRQLSDEDHERLEKIARLRVMGLHAVAWRDLLHDAIERLLDGRRRWPREVPLVVFLRETMRSIASDHWRRLDQSVVRSESEVGEERETDGGAVVSAVDETAQPERRVSAEETIRRIEDAFEGDREALCVLAAMASGRGPQEIQQEIGMDKTRYASTLRRIRRRLLHQCR